MNKAAGERYKLRIYVSGEGGRSRLAESNLRRILEQYHSGNFSLTVINVLDEPDRAEGDQILAVPALIKERPEPEARLVGDFSDEHAVLTALNLKPIETRDENRWIDMSDTNEEHYELRIYVSGQGGHSRLAVANLRRILEQYSSGMFNLIVINVRDDPERVERDQILAVPALIKERPEPEARLVGDLSDEYSVLAALDLRPAEEP